MIDFDFRERAGWDYSPGVGIVVAGGITTSITTWSHSITAEISYDYGASFQSLPNLPEQMYGNCMVIVGNKEPSV